MAELPGSDFELPCDRVILATGQTKMKDFLDKIEGLELESNGKVRIDEDSFQTSNSTYFAGGDAVNGGAEVVNAASDGKKAAKGIHAWLTGQHS